jgi:hypothetical protein
MKHAVPEMRRHQLEDLKAALEDTRAVILIGSAPSCPKFSKLCSRDGQIKCLAAPPHTAPFAQGITVAIKRIYRRKYLEEGLVLLEGIDEDEGTRDHEPLEIIASSTVKSAMYNWADPWKEVAVSTLASCWKQPLLGADPDSPTKVDFEGLEPGDFHRTLVSSSENKVSGMDVDGGVELDDRHRGYQTVTEEDTARLYVTLLLPTETTSTKTRAPSERSLRSFPVFGIIVRIL